MLKRLLLLFALAALSSGGLTQPLPMQRPLKRSDFVRTVDDRFAAMDTNHDGQVTKAELFADQQKELEQARAKIVQQMQIRFRALDTNRDGQLSFQEFLALAPTLRPMESADQLLQRLDSNHDGKVSAGEFRASELAKFNKLDANHDGILTPDEVKAAGGQK